MAHFGFSTLSVPGHLYPMSALATHVKSRGHRVTFFTVSDSEAFLTHAGLECVVLGRERFPLGYTKQRTDELSRLKGRRGLQFTLKALCESVEAYMNEVPAAAKAVGVDAFVIDQVQMAGSTVADHMRLPYVHVANALMFKLETSVPPFKVAWSNGNGPLALWRNRLAHALTRRLLRPVRAKLNAQRAVWGLPLYGEFMNERFGSRPQICQEPPGFEFPRRELPQHFHFVGPLHSHASREETPFPWERLNGKPVIYASMGTLQNGLAWTFRAIAEGCAGLEAQLVLSLGGNLEPEQFADLPGNPVVVQFAPQLQVLKRAAVCITHAGLNTALESLAQGVPMVAIPVTNDQPGVAARIAWTGAGEVVPLKKLNAASLRTAVSTVMSNPRYRENARRLRAEIAGLNSLERASEIVESVVAAADVQVGSRI
jgi:MGT family glycosyltransferase